MNIHVKTAAVKSESRFPLHQPLTSASAHSNKTQNHFPPLLLLLFGGFFYCLSFYMDRDVVRTPALTSPGLSGSDLRPNLLPSVQVTDTQTVKEGGACQTYY